MKKIPEGYKETELGVIPQEWEVSKLGDIGSFRKGKGIKKDEVIEKGLPCLRYGEIYTSYDYKFNKTKSFISEETAESSIHIQKGNIVFAGSGETVEDIGKAIVYLGDVDCYVGGDTIIMKPNKYIDGLYLSYFFGLSLVTKQKRKLGQGNAIVHIYLEGIKKIIVTYPPLPEQQKIAEILSSVDEHIEKLDGTISEYELLKKGMMKKLLTEGIGHTEFKDTELGRIPKEWEVKSTKDIFHTITDFVANGSFASLKNNVEYKDDEDYAVLIRLTDYKNKYKGSFIYVDEDSYKFLNKSSLRPNDLIIANVGANAGFIFKSPTIEKPMTLGPNSILIRSNYCDDYFYYYFSSEIGQNEISKIISTTAQPKFNKTDFKTIKIGIPPLSEQQEIAFIFSSLDERIDLYKSEKEDFVQVKKGLMEKLLTGKIRV